jgi:hypothetical protein
MFKLKSIISEEDTFLWRSRNLWIQCTECGYGGHWDADDELDFEEGRSCPECYIGILKVSKL